MKFHLTLYFPASGETNFVTGYSQQKILTIDFSNQRIIQSYTALSNGTDTTSYDVVVGDEYWFGNLSGVNLDKAVGFSVSIKTIGVPTGKTPEVLCTYRLNELGQFG